jgi:peptidyl-prolyl cis-trans isomerase A (cyclophilin A)
MNRYLWIFIVCVFVMFSTTSCKTSGKTDQGVQKGSKGAITAVEPELTDGMFAKIVTPRGTITVELYYNKTPLTVVNFVGLAEGTKDFKVSRGRTKGPYYDGLTFHRVIANFMIQGGDPLGNGTGGPGYDFPDEFVTSLTFSSPGVLAMANAGPSTNGSQFFITHRATQHLNYKHTIFGHVVAGQNVVNAIRKGDVIEKIEIIRNGDKAKNFATDQAAFDKLLAQRK